MSTLNCIVCDKELTSAIPDGMGENQPYQGTVFTSGGHYGSTVWDPMSDTFLEITVCDECLMNAAEDGRVLKGVPVRTTSTKYLPWKGPKFE